MSQEIQGEKPQLTRKKKLVFTVILLFIVVLFSTGLYLGSIFWRGRYIHNQYFEWEGSAYRADARYGYFPRSDTAVYYSLQYGERIPIFFDKNGFRVPGEGSDFGGGHPTKRVLFLGCSYTFGEGVPAENTFAYLVSKELNARCLNAGGSGWGLSQMVMRARQEIPRFRPDYVVVQASSWLIGRSLQFYAPVSGGRSPAPYFYQSEEGRVLIHQPVFTTINFRLPIAEFAGKDFFSFTWNVGIPLYVHDDYFIAVTWIKRLLGILPPPVQSREAGIDFAYEEIRKLCQMYNSKMLVVKLYHHFYDKAPDRLDEAGYTIVDTFEPLTTRLKQHIHFVPTKDTLRSLREKGMPVELSKDLKPLKKQNFTHAQTFLESIEKLIGKEQTAKYHDVLLQQFIEESYPQAWTRQYHFWRGEPLVLVNTHPNALAHQIIAETIVDSIRTLEKKL